MRLNQWIKIMQSSIYYLEIAFSLAPSLAKPLAYASLMQFIRDVSGRERPQLRLPGYTREAMCSGLGVGNIIQPSLIMQGGSHGK